MANAAKPAAPAGPKPYAVSYETTKEGETWTVAGPGLSALPVACYSQGEAALLSAACNAAHAAGHAAGSASAARLAEALERCASELNHEAENYYDEDEDTGKRKPQPHAEALYELVDAARAALAQWNEAGR